MSNDNKTFTQDEVNRIVQDRLAKEKTKLDTTLAEREAELKAKELRLAALEKLNAKGLPAELLDALNNSSPEAFEKSLEIIEQKIKSAPQELASAPIATVSTGGSHTESALDGDSIRSAMGLNGG